eukprot:COSAG02_NODE_17867_length_975_cov_0.647260_1_plen_46_part_10
MADARQPAAARAAAAAAGVSEVWLGPPGAPASWRRQTVGEQCDREH